MARVVFLGHEGDAGDVGGVKFGEDLHDDAVVVGFVGFDEDGDGLVEVGDAAEVFAELGECFLDVVEVDATTFVNGQGASLFAFDGGGGAL